MTTASRGPMTRDSDDWVERVRAASDIVEVVGQTVPLKRVGRNWMGLCPFHSEKTPSFSVNAERQFYHCFSCRAGGDVFRFVEETEKIGFLEAVELLSRRAGIPVPERRGETSRRRPTLDALEAAANAYEQWLADPHEGAAARQYLEGRGVLPETVRAYRLGVAPDAWDGLARRISDRFTAEVLVEAGLGLRREGGRGLYDRFRGRLMVPLIAPGGAIVGFGARALQPGQEPKYLNSPESSVYRKRSFVFGYEQARRAIGPEGEMVVVEGYFDAISLAQAGVRNVVATSGTALTPDHARLLQRAVATAVLTYDGDSAGQEAMLRSLGTLLAAGLEVRVAELPAGEDPDTLVRRRGREGWQEVRLAALDPVDYVQKHGLRKAGPGDPRERGLQWIVALAAEIPDPLRQRLLLERAGQVFGVGGQVLARAVGLKRSGQRSEAPVQAALRAQSRGGGYVERQLLQALLHAPEHLEGLREHLSPEDFQDPPCRAVARVVWGVDDPDEAVAALERELLAEPAEELDWGAIARGGARRLIRRRLEGRRRDVQQRLLRVQRDRPQDEAASRELLEEFQRLTETIGTMDRDEVSARGRDAVSTN